MTNYTPMVKQHIVNLCKTYILHEFEHSYSTEMTVQFSRLVRFEDPSGKIHYGEAGSDWQKDLIGQSVPTYNVTDPFKGEYSLTGSKAEISKAMTLLTLDEKTWFNSHP